MYVLCTKALNIGAFNKIKKTSIGWIHVKNDLCCNCHVLIIYNTMRLWDLEAGGVGEKSDVVDMWFATCVGMSTNWICKRIIQSRGASVNQHQGILQPLLPWWCFNSYYRLAH
jgi:hypothetical protein